MISNSRLAGVDVSHMLRAAANSAGSAAAWARKHGVSRQFVHQVLNSERPASIAMLDEIGVQRRTVTIYEMAGDAR